jgi:hypothetical protein
MAPIYRRRRGARRAAQRHRSSTARPRWCAPAALSSASPPTVRPKDGRAIFFVVEPDRVRLAGLAHRLRDGQLMPIVGAVRTLPEAPAAFALDRRTPGKTIIRVTED